MNGQWNVKLRSGEVDQPLWDRFEGYKGNKSEETRQLMHKGLRYEQLEESGLLRLYGISFDKAGNLVHDPSAALIALPSTVQLNPTQATASAVAPASAVSSAPAVASSDRTPIVRQVDEPPVEPVLPVARFEPSAVEPRLPKAETMEERKARYAAKLDNMKL